MPGIQRTLAACLVLGALVSVADEPAKPEKLDYVLQMKVRHLDLVADAEAVSPVNGAKAHATEIASSSVVDQAIELLELDKLPSLSNVPLKDVEFAIRQDLWASGSPSPKEPEVTEIELRYRSTNAEDAKTVLKALSVAYQEHLKRDDVPSPWGRPFTIDERIEWARILHDKLFASDAKEPADKEDDFAYSEDEFLQQFADIVNLLRLRKRVGRFELTDVGQPMVAKGPRKKTTTELANEEAERMFRDVERRIAKGARISLEIKKSRDKTPTYRMELLLASENRLKVAVSQPGGEDSIESRVISNGTRMHITVLPYEPVERAAPKTLLELVARGGFRIGFVDPVTYTMNGVLPTIERDVDEVWPIFDFKMGLKKQVEGRDVKVILYRFDNDDKRFQVALLLDAETLLPLRRSIREVGKMGAVEWVEIFRKFELDPTMEANEFELK